MTSAARRKVGDDQITIVSGHPAVHQYYHPVPSENDKELSSPEMSCKDGCICLTTLGVVITIVVLIFKACTSHPPTPLPKFSVSSLTVTFMNATSSYKIALDLTVWKPYSDSTKTIAYDNMVASLYYDNYFVGKTPVFPFKQVEERNSVAVVKAKFIVEVDPKIGVGVTGDYAARVSADATVNDQEWSRKLDVMCGDIWVESGSMVGPMKDCRVKGSLDE